MLGTSDAWRLLSWRPSEPAYYIDGFFVNEVAAYRISANSFRGNYSFFNLTLCTVTFGDIRCRWGNYWGNTVTSFYQLTNLNFRVGHAQLPSYGVLGLAVAPRRQLCKLFFAAIFDGCRAGNFFLLLFIATKLAAFREERIKMT